MIELIASIHWYGIGDKTNTSSAHSVFVRLNKKIKKENSYKVISFFWLVFGINLLSLFKINMHIKQVLKVYFNYYLLPTLVLIAGVICGYFTINWYWNSISNSANSNAINLLRAEALITFLATFSGILVPLLITNAQTRRAERMSLGFTLGLVWNELRINKTYLMEIKNFFKFDEHFKLSDFSRKLTESYIMIRALNTLVNKIDNSSFIASQNSGNIVKLDTDELLNSIIQAYESISYFKFSLNIVYEDLNVKNELHKNEEYKKEIQKNKPLQDETSEKIKQNLQNCLRELNDAIRVVNKAIEIVDKRLNQLGIKVEEEVKK